jgi:hypothetical protein
MANDKQRSGPFRVFAGLASLPVLLGSLPVLAAVLWLGRGSRVASGGDRCELHVPLRLRSHCRSASR